MPTHYIQKIHQRTKCFHPRDNSGLKQEECTTSVYFMVTSGIPAAWLCKLALNTASREGLLQLTIPSARTLTSRHAVLCPLATKAFALSLPPLKFPLIFFRNPVSLPFSHIKPT